MTNQPNVDIAALKPGDDIADGIYYDLPEDIYHALPRLSSSGIRNLLVSPMTFWTRSWLNTRKDADEETNKFLLKGKAYHARICEGKAAFYDRFFFNLDAADFPDALDTVTQMKEWIQNHNTAHDAKIKVSGNKPELAARILEIDPDVRILDKIMDDHASDNVGKVLLPAAWHEDLERSAAFIERHPTIKHCFTGGRPEVTICWTEHYDDGTGSGQKISVKMKARWDYGKPQAIVDLKTYGNQMDRPPAVAVAREIAAHRYHVQVAMYYRAEAAAVAQGWLPVCRGGEDTPDGRRFVFVFQGTGDDPSPIARVMDRRLEWVDLGMRQIEHAAVIFDRFHKSHGADPWLVDDPLEYLTDDDIPKWGAD